MGNLWRISSSIPQMRTYFATLITRILQTKTAWNTWYQNVMARNLLEHGHSLRLWRHFLCRFPHARWKMPAAARNSMSVVAKLVASDEDYTEQIETAAKNDNPQMPDAITGCGKTELQPWEFVDSAAAQ
jgi:hypothetical protein